MGTTPPGKIEDAAKACLAFVAKRPAPLEAVGDYIDVLRLLPGWSADELAEVNRRVTEKLTGTNT